MYFKLCVLTSAVIIRKITVKTFLEVNMKRAMKRLAIAVLALFAVSAVFASAELPLEGKTIILHSNDVHGSIAGYANIAELRNEYEAQGADVILVDAGDFSQGTAYVSTTKGADAITMMNATGYDLVTLGNHEFDYGYAQLKDNLSKAEFQVICADVFDENGNTIYPATAIIESGDVKIGFAGFETPEAQTKANPALIKGLSFASGNELYEIAQSCIDSLKAEGADIVIALSHLGVDEESAPNRSTDLYANTSGFDFIIDGHSHTVMAEGENGEPIQSTGTAFANIGVVVIDENSKTIEDNYLLPVSHDEDGTTVYDIPNDISVSGYAQEIMDRVNGEYNVVFAQSLVDLNGERDPGNRTKVSVYASKQNIDPIGTCVGFHGQRIDTIVSELNGEKIDLIEYTEDPLEYIARALSPAQVLSVETNESLKASRVIVPDDKLSLAIGKNGQNVRLAARLTGWKIEVKPESSVTQNVTTKEPEYELTELSDDSFEGLGDLEELEDLTPIDDEE